jgi:hypothetical protein
VNLLGDNIVTTKKNTKTLIDASNEGGLEVNVSSPEFKSSTDFFQFLFFEHLVF